MYTHDKNKLPLQLDKNSLCTIFVVFSIAENSLTSNRNLLTQLKFNDSD